METKLRKCLKCNEQFQSIGPENRICPRCNKQNNSLAKNKTSKYMGSGKTNKTYEGYE